MLPGVYYYSSSAQLTGVLVLDAVGDPNARFDLKIGSTLTTASAADVVLENGASGNNVYWDVGSSATLGTTTSFAGNVLAQVSITATTGATDPCGRLLAHTGAVTLDDNAIGGGCGASSIGAATPEPGCCTLALIMASLLLGAKRSSRRGPRGY